MLRKACGERVPLAFMSSLPQVTTGTETKPAAPPPRRMHSLEKKRRIVEETLRPHASVARVAQAHGVNANQVFLWRKQYQQGLLGPARPSTALLPVQISDRATPEPMPAAVTRSEVLLSSPPPEAKPTGIIHLELAKANLRLEGAVDPASLRTLLDYLLR